MTLQEFKSSLNQATPPPAISKELESLWFDGKGNWEKSHDIAQDIPTSNGSWIHAYLHRKEGDIGNANYWYHSAGKKLPKQTLEQEWEALAEEFLNR